MSVLVYSKVAIKVHSQEIDAHFGSQIEQLLFEKLPSILEEYQWFKAIVMIPLKTKVDYNRSDYEIIGSADVFDSELRDCVHSIHTYGLKDFQTENLIRKIEFYKCR